MEIINDLIKELEKSNITYQDAIAYIDNMPNGRVKEIVLYATNKHFREVMSNEIQ